MIGQHHWSTFENLRDDWLKNQETGEKEVLSKSYFLPGGRDHPKIGITNFGCILPHSARVRKQNALKILCFVICVEDYRKLTQTRSKHRF